MVPFGTLFGSRGRPIEAVFLLNFLEGLRGAFWLPFGCLLVAFWLPFGSLGEVFGRLWVNFGSLGGSCGKVVPPSPTMSYHIPPYPTTSYHIPQYRTISYHILTYPAISHHIHNILQYPTIKMICAFRFSCYPGLQATACAAEL